MLFIAGAGQDAAQEHSPRADAVLTGDGLPPTGLIAEVSWRTVKLEFDKHHLGRGRTVSGLAGNSGSAGDWARSCLSSVAAPPLVSTQPQLYRGDAQFAALCNTF